MDLIFITNDSDLAVSAQSAGVDRVMVDLEILGKQDRQGHLNTVISNHSLEDVGRIGSVLNVSKLLVRVNPINEQSKLEIDSVIEQGADIIMLPMFKSALEVEAFVQLVNGRVTTCLLLETQEAVTEIDNILSVKGIDEIHIGLNDLHLSMGLSFMFEALANGVLDKLNKKIIKAKVKFGFGGVARLGGGNLDASLILSEHIRLGSSMVILARDFKEKGVDINAEVCKIRKYLNEPKSIEVLANNQRLTYEKINHIVNKIKKPLRGS
jgi:2-keto-3-deoxy-L-rhamnonate aldolase RhmA